ncbi:MAG: polysaccharide deacetylase family protein [Treponema sp.]|nr:polysaccharide deacetylase family protein [Treponema sp.]
MIIGLRHKHVHTLLLIFLAVFIMSCATRPPPVVIEPELPVLPIEPADPVVITIYRPFLLDEEEPAEPFERALWNIKMNTQLFERYFKEGAAVAAGRGFAGTENIIVRGRAFIGGNEFRVTYDLANAAIAGRNIFYIPFFLENLTNGVSRHAGLLWSPMDEQSGILLSFDDEYWDAWRRNFDLFDRYGARVTFFVQGRFEPEALTEVELFSLEALDRGHDLGFHTINHQDLRRVSRETFYAETIEAAEVFLQAGIPFSSFAFPFGFSEPWMHESLAPFFPFIRGYGRNIRFLDTRSISRGYFVSTAIDNIVFPDETRFRNDIRLILLAAKFIGNIIVPFTTHDIADAVQWGITPGRLEFLLRTARDLRLNFYTYHCLILLSEGK